MHKKLPTISNSKQLPQQHHHTFMSLQVLFQSALMKNCHNESSERTEPNKASSQTPRPTSTTSSLLAKAFSRGRENTTTATITSTQAAPTVSASANPPPRASAAPAPIQPQAAHDSSRPTRTRVPAVTSKSMTTAPVKDKSRPPRRKYPSNMGQRR